MDLNRIIGRDDAKLYAGIAKRQRKTTQEIQQIINPIKPMAQCTDTLDQVLE
jgi:hypothetical protein